MSKRATDLFLQSTLDANTTLTQNLSACQSHLTISETNLLAVQTRSTTTETLLQNSLETQHLSLKTAQEELSLACDEILILQRRLQRFLSEDDASEAIAP